MARRHTIYGLYDPRDPDEEVRYVGSSHFTPEQRLIDHISGARRYNATHKQKWIRKLLRSDVTPAITILETTTAKLWKAREVYWIKTLLRYGARLTNSTEGGEGLINPSKDVRARISAKVSKGLQGNQRRTGKKHSDEGRAKISEGLRKSKKAKAAWKARRGKPGHKQTRKTRKLLSGIKTNVPRPDMVWFGTKQAKKNKGSFWVNNGVENKLLRKDQEVLEGFTIGRLMSRKMTTKNRCYVTNGIENRMLRADETIPTGFCLGQTKDTRYWTQKLKRQVSQKVTAIKIGHRLIKRGNKRRQLLKEQPLPIGWRFVKAS